MLIQTKYRNAEAVTIALLQALGIQASMRVIKNELFRHPRFPQLQSLCEILNTFQLRATVKNVPADQMAGVDAPFIAQTRHEGLLLVTAIKNGLVYTENENERKAMSVKDFTQLGNGTILVTSPMVLSPGRSQKFRVPAEWALSIGLTGLAALLVDALLFCTPFLDAINVYIAILVLLKSLGLAVTILLLIRTVDQQNPLVTRLCSIGRNTDCSSILNSKAAKLTPWLSWSEMGFFYFAGTWLALFTGSSSEGIWQALLFINILCLPYTIWSIYYQYKVAKKWCVLCCAVQALLWLEFIVFMLSANWHVVPVVDTGIIICLLSPVFAWMIIKHIWLELRRKKVMELQLHFTKFNLQAFNQIIQQQPHFAEPDSNYSIVLGNAAPLEVVTIVTNPNCQACVAAHQQLSELLSFNKDLQARIIFIPDTSGQNEIFPVSTHFMSLFKQGGEASAGPALRNWYQRDPSLTFEEWALKYPAEQLRVAEQNIIRQADWCQENNILSTPTILVNGYLLPDYYQLSELKYLLNRQVS